MSDATREFPDPEIDLPAQPEETERLAVFAGGCFWCVEAVFRPLEGVLAVTSGYAGDTAETATYERVCRGDTGHAEVVEVRYDPQRISYGQLLKVFFSVAHDPTQLDRQGPDRGSQYRSAVFWGDDEERRVAAAYIEQLDGARVFERPLATRLEPLEAFYEAEAVHQNYVERNPMQPYVLFNARPKVEKLRRRFRDRLRDD